ncbi:hypothetical protein ALP73_00066 [Pseudomonas coronafaciens pv. garcae]|uniref:Uncharacterized protein n=3 Tax=Pseudomonas syringae group TaxID=136849 RepID=A0AB37QUU0_9PSED|nr:Uncharacterized protein ALO66_00628 [Pseudomonas coronafaciens pv. atropurpurea]KPY03417.1 Uncharacterized protein ALO57_04253 [Pseudomonas coronafaciens pv. oryzae]RMM82050.1 hypothetical protein ALQ71_01779 [Pseudomonas coronafaciens pv. striafaciens]RMR98791.1 hypothetical protein ALP73_00066 [Pseudomonas coronafaciens pv. garcae]RMS15523.1 hypothetical protein ALP72_00476 [Pseudomonas coronafaciens pv. coronafaciens]
MFSGVSKKVLPIFNTPEKPATGRHRFMNDFTETQASALIGTAEKMVEVWSRLSPEKQSALLARFGTQENALAALVTTQLVAPANK